MAECRKIVKCGELVYEIEQNDVRPASLVRVVKAGTVRSVAF